MTEKGWLPEVAMVRRVYDKVAPEYEEASVVAREVMRRLDTRLELLAVQPQHVLDLGSGVGDYLPQLYKRYPKAAVTGLDLSLNMLRLTDKRRSLFRKARLVQADVQALPFADESVDIVTAGLVLFFVKDPTVVFQEINRVLKPSGAVLFSTLGPDSLISVMSALNELVPQNPYIAFPDMHDVGDAMLGAGLAQPVLDTEYLNVDFPDAGALLQELRRCGGINVATGRRRGLMGAAVPQILRQTLEQEGACRVKLEIIQGHAWKGGGIGAERVKGSKLPERVIPLVPEYPIK